MTTDPGLSAAPPELPQQISGNGSELWDWAAKLSHHTQLLDKASRLRADIGKIQHECGSCSKWMTRGCPMEKHSNQTGRNTGPSAATIKCANFNASTSSVKLREKWETELAAITAELSEPA